MKAEPAIPIWRSFDEGRVREFYIDFLGFEVVFEHRFAPDAQLYMGLRLGQCELHLSGHFGDASPGASMRIGVEDAHGLCAALNVRNYRHARPGVQVQPWGMEEMSTSDPFGNRLIFCAARQD